MEDSFFLSKAHHFILFNFYKIINKIKYVTNIFFPIGSKYINNRNLDKINPQSINSCTYLILYFFCGEG